MSFSIMRCPNSLLILVSFPSIIFHSSVPAAFRIGSEYQQQSHQCQVMLLYNFFTSSTWYYISSTCIMLLKMSTPLRFYHFLGFFHFASGLLSHAQGASSPLFNLTFRTLLKFILMACVLFTEFLSGWFCFIVLCIPSCFQKFHKFTK